MTLIDLANPTAFLALTARVLPWLAAVTAILLAIGLYQAAHGAGRLPAGRHRQNHVHPRAERLAVDVRLGRDEPRRARHAGVAASAGRCRRQGRRADRRGFHVSALVTGSLWGRPMWGTYWEWDARLTSVLILFLMYLGLIALWRAVEDPSRAARAAAVLTLVGALNLPIIKFSVDWWNTLHQPASVLRMGGPTHRSAPS